LAREFVITSREDGATLRLSCPEESWGSITAEASGSAFSVRIPVYTDLSPSLPDFFEALLVTPNVGRKEFSWETIEGELKFSASLDSLGHVFLVYHLRSPDIGSNKWWSFTGRLVLEVGTLPDTCKRLRRFWRTAT
jgi:Family of unknown function (DUF6228)